MATKTATVQSGQVTGTHTNFPAFIDPANVGITTQAELDSVRVYTDASLTTEIARECVSLNEMHVKIPTLTSSTQIWIDYDGVRADYAVTDTYGRNAVWSDYEYVHHMNGSSTTITDSTGNGKTGTKQSSTRPNEVTAELGDGQYFAESTSSDFIDIANTTSSIPGSSNFTVSLYTKVDATAGNGAFLSNNKVQTGRWDIFTWNNAGNFSFFANASPNVFPQGTSDIRGAYHHCVLKRDGNDWYIIVDGTQEATTSNSATLSTANDHRMGRFYPEVSGSRNLEGIVDELRIRQSALSANWITTESNNQNDEATFWGTWTDVGGGPTPANVAARRLLLLHM